MASSLAAVPAPAALPQFSYAGLGRRLAAFFVDLPIAYAPVLLVGIVFRIARALRVWIPASEGLTPEATWRAMGISAKLAIIVAFLVSMGSFYLALFESSPWQASFGKRLLGIYVTDDEGRRISVGRGFGRWFAKVFLNYFWLWPISMITIAATARKKALHDFVAKTLIVRGRTSLGGSLEVWRVFAAFGIPFVWLLATFFSIL